ncbi:MAG: NAD-dependent epimerase/dehydratase family protein [Microgenomates group bacterium]
MKDTRLFLVTGGSGFLGINCIRYLLHRGCRVRSLDIAPFTYPEKTRVVSLVGDIRDKKTVEQAMRGVDVVVHCAAALPLYTKEDIYSTEVTGTEIVLAAAKKLHISCVIYISSTAVYGIPDHHPIVETDRMIGVGPYGEAKIQAEALCRRARAQGLCVPIIRPKTFVGPERLGIFGMLYDWAYTGHGFPMIGSGNHRYQLLDVEDLCQFIYLVSCKPRDVVNTEFNVGALKFGTMREDFQSVLTLAGHGKKIIGFAEQPVIFGLKVLEALHLSPVYEWIYETAGKDSFVSIVKAQKIGYKPQYSNSDALKRNYMWYVKNLPSFARTTGISHRVPWGQGILQFAKLFF